MRGIQSKRIMKMARDERRGEQGVTERGLVQKKTGSVVHGPHTIRAMYLQLKRRFNFLSRFAGEARKVVERVRAAVKKPNPPKANTVKPQGAVAIENPLMWILGHCPPSQSLTNDEVWEPHPTYLKARRAADRGDGATVKRIAAQFA